MALIRDAAGLAGAASVSYGAWLIYEPAGFVAGGLILMVAAIAAARSG